MTDEKTRETRLRRMAQRQGLILRKSRRRDPRAVDYGSYILVDANTNAVVVGGVDGAFQHGPDLDVIERALTEGR
jgi:hypothetical protein